MRFRNIILICGLLVFVLYGNTLRNGYNFDDTLVTQKHRLTSKGISTIPEIFTSYYYEDEQGYKYEYRPVTLATFAIEHQFFGEKPEVSHFINVLLYLFCVIAFIITLSLLFPADKRGYFILFPALLFTIHPLHTEVVASIKNREEILSLLFVLLSFNYTLKYISQQKKIFVFLSILFFLISLFSKNSSAAYAVLIPFFVNFFLKNNLLKSGLISIIFLFPVYFFFNAPFLFIAIGLVVSSLFPFLLANKIFFSFSNLKQVGGIIPEKIQAVRKSTHPGILVFLFAMNFSLIGFYFLYDPVFTAKIILVASVINILFISFFEIKNKIVEVLLYSLTFFLVILCGPGPGGDDPLNLIMLMIWIAIANIYPYAKSKVIYSLCIMGIPTLLSVALFIYDKPVLDSFVFMIFGGISILMSKSLSDKKNKTLALFFWLLMGVGIVSLLNRLSDYDTIGFFDVLTFVLVFGYLRYFKNRTIAILILSILLPVGLALNFKNLNNLMYIFSADVITKTENHLPMPEIVKQSKRKTIAKIITGEEEDRPIDFVEFPLGFNAGLSEKAGTAAVVMGHYLKMMFIPYPMRFYYGYNQLETTRITDLVSIISIIIHLLILFSAIYFLIRHPLYSFGVFAYLSSIFLFSNLLTPVAGIVGDRLTFTASVGFALALGYIIAHIYKNQNSEKRKILSVVFTIVAFIYSGMTIARNAQWKDHLTLYKHDIKYLQKSAQAQNLLATRLVYESNRKRSLVEQEKLRQEAVIYYKRTLEIYPHFFNAQYDLARTFELLSDAENAIREYKKTIALDSLFMYPYVQIGLIYESQNQLEKAIPYFEKFMELNPTDLEIYNTLSRIYFRLGDFNNAIKTNLKAMDNFPGVYEPVVNIGKTYFTMGNKKNALIYFEKAYLINPNDINLVITMAKSYQELGETGKADFYYSKANQLKR